MRLRFALVVFLSLTAPVLSAAAKRPTGSAASVGLRGAQSDQAADAASTPPVKPAATRLVSPAPRPPLAVNGALGDSAECRLTCAHNYYRCAPTAAADNCPVLWTLCQAGCARVDQRRR